MVWLEAGFMLIHTVIDLIWRSSALIQKKVGHISTHTTLYLHDFDCSSYESLLTSSLISYATIVWLEPQFALIHTVIDLIWRSSAVIRSSAEAASEHIRHCSCMSSTVDPMNRCRHPL